MSVIKIAAMMRNERTAAHSVASTASSIAPSINAARSASVRKFFVG